MGEEFLNQIINEDKNINEVIFRNYVKHQNPSSLVKDLFKANKNDKTKYMIINELIKLMEDIHIKEITGNENPKNKSILLTKSLILMNSKKVEDSKC